MVIKVKDGVTPRNLVIACAAANVGQTHGLSVVITSGTDGKHMEGSKHYTSEALDFRLLGTLTERFIEAMQGHLGPDYQIVLETDHVHVEYDPRPVTT